MFKESLHKDKRVKDHIIQSFRNYSSILRNRTFMQLTAVLTLLSASLFAYISALSFIYQQHYGYNSLWYEIFFAINASGFTLGAHLSGRTSSLLALKIGIWGSVFTCLILLATVLYSGNFWLVEILFFSFGLFYGLVMPSGSAVAIKLERKFPGSASAMIGFCPFFLCSVASPLTGIDDPFKTTAIIMMICSFAALFIFRFINIQKI